MDVRKEVEHALEDAAYVAVGLAVIELQRAQVRRRALMDHLGRIGGLLVGSGTRPAAEPGAGTSAAAPEDGPAA